MFEGLPRERKWAIWLMLLLAHIYFLQIYPAWISPGEASRFFLISAVVDHHTLSIDQPIRDYFDTQDKAVFHGKYYCDKAIGTSLLGIIPYFISKNIANVLGISWPFYAAILTIRLFCVILPAILFLKPLTAYWKEVGIAPDLIPYAAFVYLFGTLAFPYSVQFISHYLLGMLLFLSFLFIYRAKASSENRDRNLIYGGALAGLSMTMEYPAIVASLILLAYSIYVLPSKRTLLLVLAGFLPFVAMVAAYHYAIFGNPFDVPYKHVADASNASYVSRGFVGIGIPTFESLKGILFSRFRGLFFWSPVLLFSIPGFYTFFKKFKTEAWLFLAISGSMILIYGSYSYWVGGWNLGPRFLASVVPFLFTPAVLFFSPFKNLGKFKIIAGLALSLASFILITLGTITFPYPPAESKDPFFQIFLPLFLHGAFGLSLGDLFGVSLLTGAILFYTLLLILFILMVAPESKTRIVHKTLFTEGAAAAGLTILLFSGGYFTSPPLNAFDHFAIGRIYYFLGYHQDAYTELTEAASMNPKPSLKADIAQYIGKLRTR